MSLRLLVLLSVGLLLRAAEPSHLADDGVAVVELERLPPQRGWALERTLPGFTGESYLVDRGGGQALSIQVLLPRSGRWWLVLRNRHEHPDHTLENDCWVSIDGSPPVKTFSSTGGQWTWATKQEPSPGTFRDPAFDLAAGLHELVISGRSSGFHIDRLHLHLEGAAGAQDETRPETAGIPALPPLVGLKTIAAAWSRGELGRALSEARLQAAKPQEPALAERIAVAQAQLEASHRQRLATLAEMQGDEPELAAVMIGRWAKVWRGCPEGEALAVQAKAWAADPAVAKARAARLDLEPLLAAEAKLRAAGLGSEPTVAKRRAAEIEVLRTALERLVAKHPGTPAARQAQRLADGLAPSRPAR